MSRRRPGAGDDLEIEFEGFDHAMTGATDVTLGHAPFGHGPPRSGGRRWRLALAAVAAVSAVAWFLATRHTGGAPDTAGNRATVTTPPRSSERSAKTTTGEQRSPTVVTVNVAGAPLMGAPTGHTLHFTDQAASVTFALDVDTGALRQVAVKAGLSDAVVTPGHVVGLTHDGRLAVVGSDGRIELVGPAAGVVAVGDGSVWVAVAGGGRLRLNRLIPASDLVTESRMSPGPTRLLAGSDAKGNPVVLAADGHLYAIAGDGSALRVSDAAMVPAAVGGGDHVVAGAYGETTCSASMRCVDVFHGAGGGVVEVDANGAGTPNYSFSPDGKRVALVDAPADRIDVFDFSGRPPVAIDVVDVVGEGTAQAPVWSPDGRYVFTYLDRRVRWGDVSTGRSGSFEVTRSGVALVLVGVE